MGSYTEQDVRDAHSATALDRQARYNDATVEDYAASLDLTITEPEWRAAYQRGEAILAHAILRIFTQGEPIPPADSPVVWLHAGYIAMSATYHACTLTRKRPFGAG